MHVLPELELSAVLLQSYQSYRTDIGLRSYRTSYWTSYRSYRTLSENSDSARSCHRGLPLSELSESHYRTIGEGHYRTIGAIGVLSDTIGALSDFTIGLSDQGSGTLCVFVINPDFFLYEDGF